MSHSNTPTTPNTPATPNTAATRRARRPTTPPRPLIRRDPLSVEERFARSDELYRLHDPTASVPRHFQQDRDETGRLVHIPFTIQSANRPDIAYTVHWYAPLEGAGNVGPAYCECPAGQYDQPCWHVGAVRAAGAVIVDYLAWAETDAGRAQIEADDRALAAAAEWQDSMYSREYRGEGRGR